MDGKGQAHNHPGSDGGFILARADFRSAIEQERALSDRSGEPFALLVFELGSPPSQARTDAALGALSKRVRATDVLGWLSEHELGVLLRYARVEDALRVAHEVRAHARAAEGELCCTVHGHPPVPRPASRPHQTAPSLSHHVASQSDHR